MTDFRITIRFNRSNSAKIKVIQAASDTPKTYSHILEELLDLGYSDALEMLYRQKRISANTYQIGLRQVPNRLRSRLGS
jgi:hypothetical protein